MTHFKNPKAYLISLLAGALIFIGANYILKIVNVIFTFIPQDLFKNFLGLTPHIIISYGLAYMIYQEILERTGLLKY